MPKTNNPKWKFAEDKKLRLTSDFLLVVLVAGGRVSKKIRMIGNFRVIKGLT